MSDDAGAQPLDAGADLLDPALSRLAAAHGVATQYDDWQGDPTPVAAPAVVAALTALGVDASTPAAIERSVRELEGAPWQRVLPPTVVVRGATTIDVHAPESSDLLLTLHLEDGSRRELVLDPSVTARSVERVRRRLMLPELPLGWHRLVATGPAGNAAFRESESRTDDAVPAHEAVLVVAPDRLPVLGERSWGWALQLYSLRSARSWAMGDYADLRTVVERVQGDGAGLVLLNPLHAETPVVPIHPSPYSPSSRRFRSVLSLSVEDIAEYALAPAEVRAAVDALRPVAEADRIPRDPVWEAKLAALELLWPHHRTGELERWREQGGRPLAEYAIFCALAEAHGGAWQRWPEPLRHPASPAVAERAAELSDRVAFWGWAQLLVDEQLQGIGSAMRVGVVHDLAVGVDAGGADAWALQDALALATTVGAPPDSFNQQGQDWGLPPWRPDRLAELGYAPFRDVVRGVLRHAGGLRIDHVMGLFRLWWVPAGATAADGTYVSYDADAMLAVLALEASRAGAVVIGEDLGTVENRVRADLERTGVLGSGVLWFEQDDDGAFLPPERWRADVLASVTTHDLPTAAGLLTEEQVRVRDELDQLAMPVEQERARARQDCAALLDMLVRSGELARHDGDPVLAMHGVLVDSPARLVLAAFGDAVGDRRQPNLPGTVDAYPNWRLPVADERGRPLQLEQLLEHPGVRRLTALLAEGVAAGLA